MSAWRKARFERVMRRSSQAEAERVTGASQTAALPKVPHFNKMSINEHRVHFRSLYLLQGHRARQTARKCRFFKKSSSLAEKSAVRTRSRCANPLAVRESEAFALRLSATAT